MVTIRKSEELLACVCGTATHREMVWSFEGDRRKHAIPFCSHCEDRLKKYFDTQSKNQS